MKENYIKTKKACRLRCALATNSLPHNPIPNYSYTLCILIYLGYIEGVTVIVLLMYHFAFGFDILHVHLLSFKMVLFLFLHQFL